MGCNILQPHRNRCDNNVRMIKSILESLAIGAMLTAGVSTALLVIFGSAYVGGQVAGHLGAPEPVTYVVSLMCVAIIVFAGCDYLGV